MSVFRLSILVPTLPERTHFLRRLRMLLEPQMRGRPVELLLDERPRPVPIGTKRNALLDRARGDYVAFVDDDDLVSGNYVRDVLEAVKTSPDCVGLNGIITFDGKNPRKFIHTIECKEWHEKDGIYYRMPNHLNPIRRDLALAVRFPAGSNFGEDHDFSKRIQSSLKSEVMVRQPLYFYASRSVKKEFAK